MVVAATGDDKANVVLSLLAKTEFAVPRVVARVNDPRNEWLFNDAWGVDVAVSTPRMLASLVEEAVAVGDLVRLMEFRKGQANLVEITLPDDTPWGGKPVRRLELPRDAALVTILRGPRVIVPQADEPLEGGDELLFVAAHRGRGGAAQAAAAGLDASGQSAAGAALGVVADRLGGGYGRAGRRPDRHVGHQRGHRGQRPAHRDPRHAQPAGLIGVVQEVLDHESRTEHQHPDQRGDVERIHRAAHARASRDHGRCTQLHT